MNRCLVPLIAAFCCTPFSFAFSQEAPPAKVSKEHRWLQQFVGEWTTEVNAPAQGDQPAMHCKGTMSSQSLGMLWVVNEIKTDMPGVSMHGVQTIGYDPAKKKYVGTWVDSIMNYLWRYEGSVDATGKTLTLNADGPNILTPGKTAKYRDIYTFTSPNEIVVTSSAQSPSGEWVPFMTGKMRRKQEFRK